MEESSRMRKVKARDLPWLALENTVVWNGQEVVSARAGWGPQARKYTFYKGTDGVEHRTSSADVIEVEVTPKTEQAEHRSNEFEVTYPTDSLLDEVVVTQRGSWVATFPATSLQAADDVLRAHGYRRASDGWLQSEGGMVATYVRG